MRIVHYAMQARGNVDSLWWAIQKDAAKYGHSSIELKLAGIPLTPEMEQI